jgi:acyl transferase domain-containing protein/thioesterase domain-containing protein
MATNDSSDAAESGIAIVGMGLRVPGARTPGEYWKNVAAGVESVRQLTDEELIANGENAERLKHPRYVKSASILQDMDTFDPEFFGLSPKEAGIMDPQHRQLLETAWEALEDAGHTPEKFEGPIGVWAGCGMGAYFAHNILTNRELLEQVGLFLLRHTGNDKDFLPTRISYCLNLRGPSVGVQTACSTSLVAVHYACQALLNRECDMALAGGVTIEIPHARGYIFEEGEILSPDGHCRAFDHRSNGTIFGSGAGIVVLRRLEDALADGDQIYAVIKGSAVNNDGSGKVGYLAPSVEGQAAAIAEALAVADISAATIGYVECHGTGTAVGDPIEIAALTEAFRETTDRKTYCGIGSVKTNIGHLDTAAGVASLIKASLALKNRKLPPSLNFEQPNPHIDFASTPFFVNDKLRDFPAPTPGGRRRATVNSLGVGGTNAHVVLEEAPPRPQVAQTTAFTASGTGAPGAIAAPATAPAPELLLLSARSRPSLDGSSKKLGHYLRETPNASLSDVAFTLATGRAPFQERRVLVARDREHAVAQLDALDPRKVFTHAAVANASVVFMFPGGGAQYPNMGRRLYETEPVFKEHIDRGLNLLRKKVAFDPMTLLFPEPSAREKAAAELERPSYQLPLIFIVEFALAKLWQSLGITPAALIGHSVGENTAAAVAGVFAYEDALDLILLRGRLMDEVPEGAMMSVPLSAHELLPLLGTELDLACVNSPELCVASGPRPQILALQKQLAEREVECQLIRINIAAHSRMLDGALERFGAFLRKIRLSAPTLPVISNRTGKRLLPEEARSPEYWVEHLRNTVLFGEGVGTLLEQPGRVFLEVGPGRALSSLARNHPSVAQGQAFIGSLPHVDDDTPDHEIFLAAFGRLWAAGVEVDLEKARKNPGQRISLPTYAFQKQRYWIDQKTPTAPQESTPYPKRLDSERWFFAPTWRAHYPDVDPDTAPHTWLVFVDETGLGQRVADSLRSAGNEVVTVRLGDTFVKVTDHEYRLAPEHGTDGYESLIREVLQSGKPPDRIAHFWLLSDGETFRPGSSFFHRNQELGFYSLLFLAQALSAAELPVRLHISVITRGMQKVGSTRLRYPDQATVLGPVKVIPRELEGVTCTSIDLEPLDRPEPIKATSSVWNRLLNARKSGGEESSKNAPSAPGADDVEELDALLSELRMPASNGEISLADDSRWVRRYEAIPAPRAEKPKLRQGGVYLVTGGLGGIGFTIAKSLAESEHAKLVLINRTPLPPREEWEGWLERRPAGAESARIRTVQKLEALGAEVLVASGDVADLDRMSEVLEETKARFGALHGVIHAAGVLDDAPLGAKRQASVESVFGPKVYGTMVLDRVLKNEPLDFFVVFSSTSTAIAAAGQVDYVAANSFLDAFADKARAEGRNVLSLAWGVWAEVGLAASAADKLGGDNTQGRGSPCTYPLFTGKWLSQGSSLLRGTLDPGALWILDEHRTENRQAVLPGTGYLELARAALREVGHDGPFAIEDLYFLRPLDVPDAGGLEFRVRLKSSDDGFNFEVQSKRRLSDGREGYVLHAQAFLRRFLPVAPAPLDLAELDQRCTVQRVAPLAEGHRVKQERHLLFGARWRNLRRYAIGEGEAFAELTLRDTFVPDLGVFGMHPGMLDIATGFAIELEPSYGSDRLWVPVSYDRVSVYGDLTPTLYSHVQLRPRTGGTSAGGFARFDITLSDDKGNVLVDIDGFAMQAIAGTSFEIVEPRAQELEQEGPRRELAPAERAFLHNLSEGITPKEGVEAFRRLVDAFSGSRADPRASTPRARVLVSSMDVRQLVKQADLIVPQAKEEGGAVTFERPALSSEYVAPRNEVEKSLAAMWENLLGVSQVGVHDNFFELGGHSLVAVRLFARMKKTFGVDYPISVLIERPTIEGCAALVAPSESESAAADVSVETPRAERETRYKHLVPMNPPSGDRRGRLPFFLVAGMFGNVMNLRHLAGLVGEERPFHGLQARGLLGNENPHETFEETARDYLAEIRAVQPRGPYLLGGFSGGGITAYEMARQLVADGEEVPLIVMLDTPIPHDEPLTVREKLSIHQQNFQRDGAQYVMRWAEDKLAYKKRLEARAAQAADQEKGQDSGFRSQVIEAAFYRAIERYTLVASSFHLALFRPRLKAAFKFGPGRAINVDRRRIYYDNGWAPYALKVDVFETPGDHDSMVLEPNVRILAARLRECLDQAEARTAHKEQKSQPAEKAAAHVEASL